MMRTRALPLSHNRTFSCVTPASRAARIAKSSIGTDTHQQRDVETKSRKAHRHDAGTTQDLARANAVWPAGESPANRQKQVEAQSALRRLEAGGVLRRAGTEPLEVTFAVISFVCHTGEVAGSSRS